MPLSLKERYGLCKPVISKVEDCDCKGHEQREDGGHSSCELNEEIEEASSPVRLQNEQKCYIHKECYNEAVRIVVGDLGTDVHRVGVYRTLLNVLGRSRAFGALGTRAVALENLAAHKNNY